MSDFSALQHRICQWMLAHGGQYEAGPWLHKLTEEVGELNGAYVKQQGREALMGELADILICLVIVAYSLDVSLVDAAYTKMTVNEGRRLRVNDFGVLVKEGD